MSWILGAALTAAAMLLCGWAVSGVDMAGPRPGTRIALLVPQIEVSLLFLVAVPWWAWRLAGRWPHGLRQALAATRRGGPVAVQRASVDWLRATAPLLIAGALTWTAALALPGGPSPARLLAGRALLIAFVVFAAGLAAFSAAVAITRSGAALVAASVVVVMAATPVAIAPIVATFGTSPLLAQAAMLVNPWIVAAGSAGLDLIRMQWVYALSPLAHVEVEYPAPIAAVLAYAAVGGALASASVAALRPSWACRGAR